MRLRFNRPRGTAGSRCLVEFQIVQRGLDWAVWDEYGLTFPGSGARQQPSTLLFFFFLKQCSKSVLQLWEWNRASSRGSTHQQNASSRPAFRNSNNFI